MAARSPGSYSRIVSWLKLLLPLVALGLLSTIFLFARNADPTANIPVATARDLAGRASQMVTDPRYSGTTDSGASVTLTAARARPDPEAEGQIRAETLEAAMAFEDGSRIDLAAPDARLRDSDDEVQLSGGVTITSSQGYRLTTDSLTAAMTRIEAQSGGAVRGEGPAGTIEAGRLRIEETGSEGARPGDVRLLFTGGVDVVYEP
ncbi:LPS export ABC transporter periplasmic protein LptC [Roseivivax sediminis]|uniref:Lipopolysaccharide export system protein LptC n=1 Tax=Roseivivax sediminis TaxID=936889 RepID=A0A1I2B4X0_9RHOB|nr:LPS export ABC transporter periplasmic protein LptC [Roseivivax sediminis]SFE51027.1 lipopolysaccharide export system protein LptC [Roseivivax sediminis]